MAKMISSLIFDLDGTLSDPSVGITHSINYALVRHGCDPVDIHDVAPHIGPPLVDMFRLLTGSTDHRLIASCVAAYRRDYNREPCKMAFSPNLFVAHKILSWQ